MKTPAMNQAGMVDLQSFSALPYEDMRKLILDTLQGLDLAFPSERDDSPHFVVSEIYENLNRPAQRDLEAIVVEFLRDLAHDTQPDWVNEFGSELLMLADPILLGASKRDRVVGYLHSIINRLDRSEPQNPDLRFRALQALVTLRHRADRPYWNRQYEVGGQAYLPVILEGLSLIDVSAPIEWLKDMPWSRSLEQSIFGLLPSLLEDYGVPKVMHVLGDAIPRLSSDARQAILQFCDEEGLTLDGKPESIQYALPQASVSLTGSSNFSPAQSVASESGVSSLRDIDSEQGPGWAVALQRCA